MPRSYHHDYQSKCIYHITLTKSDDIPDFGYLDGNVENARIKRSIIGSIVEDNVKNLTNLSSKIKLFQYAIMPDHVHILIYVTDRIERHLGKYIGMLKVRIGQQYSERCGQKRTVFKPDFDDRIIYKNRSLDAIFRYIRDNPKRLAQRKANPDYFKRINNLRINGKSFQAYGNMQLLMNPFMDAVIIHRKDNVLTRQRNREEWLYTAANGGVLISAFVSKDEKAIRQEAERINGKIILIREKPFQEREKPSSHYLDLCSQGRLLIIAPIDSDFPISAYRDQCLAMNAIASEIASHSDISL